MKRERRVSQKNKQLLIRFPYDSQIVEAVRGIPNRRWNKKRKEWACPLDYLPEAVEKLSPFDFDFPAELVSQVDSIRASRKAKEERQQKKVHIHEEAKRAFMRCTDEKAFVPSHDSLLTRRIKEAGIYRPVRKETSFGSTIIGHKVPDATMIEVLKRMGRSTHPFDRLLQTLKYLFKINAEAKTVRSFYSTATTRYAKKTHLLAEACRLAAKQNQLTWGWKEDPCPPPNGAKWVLYFEMENKQISFHTFQRGEGPNFAGEWNGIINRDFPW